MGRGGGVASGRAPSQPAYFVALAGVAALLLMLCCYFFYFCFSKINELSERASLCGETTRAAPAGAPPKRHSYPVQPVVRDSATAMAQLCQALPRAPPAAAPAGAPSPAASPPPAPRGPRSPASEAATLSEDTASTAVSPPPAT